MEDNEIIKRCKDGEKEAFNELICKYHPFVYKYLYRISEDDQIAEDLVQETFVKIIRSIEKFDPKGSARFSTYLIQIAKNCYIDHYRKEKKRASDVPLDEIIGTKPTEKDITEFVTDKLYNQNVLKLLEDLPEDQQIAIKMKYIEDLTLKEIGDILDVEPKTIKSRIHNGMVRLRKMIKGGEYDERN